MVLLCSLLISMICYLCLKKKTACYVGDSQICLNCKTSELSDAIHEVNLDLTEFVDGTAKTRCSKSQNRPEFL